MTDYTVVLRAVADGRQEYLQFAAASRDEALFEGGLFAGRNYSGRWELVRVDEGWEW